MVGQRFTTLLENHPWFDVTALAASAPFRRQNLSRRPSAGRWVMDAPMPAEMAKMHRAVTRRRTWIRCVSLVDFVFCAVNMKKEEIRALEEKYAKAMNAR